MLAERGTDNLLKDLRWVIRSPTLTAPEWLSWGWLDDEFCQAAYARCAPLIDELEGCREHVLEQLVGYAPRSQLLGSYFEWLVALWLSLDPRFDVLAHNMAIRNHERTLGELDFVLWDKETHKTLHLEVAVKFYLGLAGGELNHWFGPGLKDRLDKKFNHMQWHQMPLAKTDAATQVLATQGITIDRSYSLLKGRVYLPELELELPTISSPESLHSRWVCFSDYSVDQQNDFLLDKPAWLTTEQASSKTWDSLDWQYPVHIFSASFNAPLFLVPDDWAHQAESQLKKERENLLGDYEHAIYEVCIDGQWVSLQEFELDSFIITAYNPGQQRPSQQENEKRNSALEELLKQRKVSYIPAKGLSTDRQHSEASFAVLGCGMNHAKHLASVFGQAAIYAWDAKQKEGELIWV